MSRGCRRTASGVAPGGRVRDVLVVGLTGGIGSGKSTVSALLAEKGAVVIDADAITKELQQPGTDVFAAMVERFGPASAPPPGRSTGPPWPTSSSTTPPR